MLAAEGASAGERPVRIPQLPRASLDPATGSLATPAPRSHTVAGHDGPGRLWGSAP